MSHANTTQIFHVNTFFFLFGVFCSIRIGVENVLMRWIEWNIISWTCWIIMKNHCIWIMEPSIYTFYHLSSENKELSAPCLSIIKVAIVESPLDYLKTYGYLLAFLGGRDNGLSIGTMNLLRDQDIVLGFQKWLLWEKRTYMEENVNVWRDYFEVKYDIPL